MHCGLQRLTLSEKEDRVSASRTSDNLLKKYSDFFSDFDADEFDSSIDDDPVFSVPLSLPSTKTIGSDTEGSNTNGYPTVCSFPIRR